MSTNDPNDFLMGGSGKSARFDAVGDTISGTITVTPELRQQTDIKDNKPQFWDDGQPKMQLVVKLQTDARDDADDDGVRALYVAGGFKRMSLQRAVAEAVKAAGAKGLAVGGKLSVRFTGEEPATTRGFNPAKLYAAKYEAPAAGFLDAPATAGATEPDPWSEVPF